MSKKPSNPDEFDFGWEMAAKGNKVNMRGAGGASGPDFIINEQFWELKTLKSPKNLEFSVRDKIDQFKRYNINNNTSIPPKIFIDARQITITEVEVRNQINRAATHPTAGRNLELKNPPPGTEVQILLPGGKKIIWPWR